MEDNKIKDLVKEYGTPQYIYDEKKIIERYNFIKNSLPYENKEIHYAAMCNENPEILKVIKKCGGSLQINSLHELRLAKEAGFESNRISLASTGLSKDVLRKLIKEGVQVNLDSLEEVQKYCSLNPGGKFAIRIKMKEDISLPEGHTNSPRSSDIGIRREDFHKVKEVAEKSGCEINGVHGYLASNILDYRPFLESSRHIIDCAKEFENLEYINFGSGFGVPTTSEGEDFEFGKVGKHYSELMKEISECFGKDIQLKIEPGRSVAASSGVLCAKVTNVKSLEDKKQITIDAGFGELARPRIYGAYHEIRSLKKEEKSEVYDVRGNTVLQSDFLGRNVKLPEVSEGDILVIENVGAYGMAMASGFPGQEMPRETLVFSDGSIKPLSPTKTK